MPLFARTSRFMRVAVSSNCGPCTLEYAHGNEIPDTCRKGGVSSVSLTTAIDGSSMGRYTSQVLHSSHEMRQLVAQAHRVGQSVGLVPTMGALHRGHLSLVDASIGECDRTIVTIFVNPTQFLPGEDYDRYPRSVPADLELLSEYPVDWVFAPSVEEMYPRRFSTYVHPPAVSEPWEGVQRPGHFRGVTTVVLKLFHIIPADVAYFGHKDYQQSQVIRRMVEDLSLPITIRVCPTVRDPDGMALSSRNQYLQPHERNIGLSISQGLNLATDLVAQGERRASVVLERVRRVLEEAGVTSIDYVALVHPDTMESVSTINNPTLAIVAVWVGATRLIDNRLIG